MNAIQSLMDPRLLAELTMHLRKTGSKLSPAEAAAVAIRTWINAQQRPALTEAESGDTRGYQWKSLFLPEGTELRMSTVGSTYHARVVGDEIVFNGRKVSPRGMTLAIAGEGRNAWRDIWVKLPGEGSFIPASRCRREQEREQALPAAPAAAPAASPADSLNAAVLTMSEALTTMLALMQQASAPKKPVDERRVTAPRREVDIMADCAFD